MSRPDFRSPHLALGYVARAHALRGEVAIKTFDPASETLFEVERVVVRPRVGPERELTLEDARLAGKEILVAFAGVMDRPAAEALVGATVLAFREDLAPLEEGEYFQGDLVGLAAVDMEGRPLGEVVEVWSTGEVPNLVIRGAGLPELMVPFIDDFVPEVRLEARQVVIRPPEYDE